VLVAAAAIAAAAAALTFVAHYITLFVFYCRTSVLCDAISMVVAEFMVSGVRDVCSCLIAAIQCCNAVHGNTGTTAGTHVA
jgi:hypothetical protein